MKPRILVFLYASPTGTISKSDDHDTNEEASTA